MLHLLYEYRSCSTALDIIKAMHNNHIRVNSGDYMDAIRVCSRSNDSDSIASSLWNMMLSDGYIPSRIDYEILMNCFIRSGAIADAERIFESIRIQGLKPSVWTYNTLLNGYKQNGSWERALQVYQFMQLEGIKPDGITYTILLDLLFKTQKVEYSQVIIKDIQNGKDIVSAISSRILELYPDHLMGDVNLFNSTEFFSHFNQLFEDQVLYNLHHQFSKLFLKKSFLNPLILWYIYQDNRTAIFYLYNATQRSKKSAPNDLTYKLLFHYCGIKKDLGFFEFIMNNAVSAGFSYNVLFWECANLVVIDCP